MERDGDDFLTTKRMMRKLWPRWVCPPELGATLNAVWAKRDQAIMRECIGRHRLVREYTPDVTAIDSAYSVARKAAAPAKYIQATTVDQQSVQTWADRVVESATPEEIAHCQTRLRLIRIQTDTPSQRRMAAAAIEWVRQAKQQDDK